LPDEILSRLDVVIAGVHTHFDLPRAEQTNRVVKAMENRHVAVVAHPTGRLIGQRGPMEIDMDRVIAQAARLGCHLEINAEPDRLDLNDLYIQAAKSAGVKLAISTNAHAPAALSHMRFGVDQARRGWLNGSDVVNTRSLRELKNLLKR